jgi:hypothetical protein
MSASGDYDNVEIGGMIGRGNQSTRRKLVPVPLCPPQIPHAARTRTRAASMGSQRQTAELRHGLAYVLLPWFITLNNCNKEMQGVIRICVENSNMSII